MHPIHIFPPYFPKIHSNVIFPSTPGSSKWSLPYRFESKYCIQFSSLPSMLHVPPIIFIALVVFCEAFCSLLPCSPSSVQRWTNSTYKNVILTSFAAAHAANDYVDLHQWNVDHYSDPGTKLSDYTQLDKIMHSTLEQTNEGGNVSYLMKLYQLFQLSTTPWRRNVGVKV
jgi:hypothetical protein